MLTAAENNYKIFVKHLAEDVTEQDLRDLFPAAKRIDLPRRSDKIKSTKGLVKIRCHLHVLSFPVDSRKYFNSLAIMSPLIKLFLAVRRFAYVLMETEQQVADSVAERNGTEFHGRQLVVDFVGSKSPLETAAQERKQHKKGKGG